MFPEISLIDDVLKVLGFGVYVLGLSFFIGLLIARNQPEVEPEDVDEPWGSKVVIVPPKETM